MGRRQTGGARSRPGSGRRDARNRRLLHRRLPDDVRPQLLQLPDRFGMQARGLGRAGWRAGIRPGPDRTAAVGELGALLHDAARVASPARPRAHRRGADRHRAHPSRPGRGPRDSAGAGPTGDGATGRRGISGQRLGAVPAYETAELCLDLTRRDPGGPLLISPQLRVGDVPVVPLVLIGSEGNGVAYADPADTAHTPDPANWRFRLA